MNKTKIEWCDMTWNPVTGCLHGCEYCYATQIARRFGDRDCGYTSYPLEDENKILALTMPIYGKDGRKLQFPYGFHPTFHRYRLNEPAEIKKPQNIFACSMADLFGDWVPDKWIEEVFKACTAAPQHRYLFLTKNPDRYYQLSDDNYDDDNNVIGKQFSWGDSDDELECYFGASASTQEQAESAYENLNCSWMSLEPLMDEFDEDFFVHDNRYSQSTETRWAWIVLGAETGNRKGKVTPKRAWIENILTNCRETGTPVFMKNNLVAIWGEPLIQEYPWEEKINDSQRS